MTIRWINRGVVPDGLAVDRGIVYVFGADSLDAFSLKDGSTVWSAWPPDLEGLTSSGDVRIGSDGPGRIRVWAPYETDLIVSRATGAVLHRGIAYRRGVGKKLAAEPPPSFKPFRTSMPPGFSDQGGFSYVVNGMTFTDTLDRLVIRHSSGQIAGTFRIREPFTDGLGPIAVPGGAVLGLSSEDIVVVDYTAE